VSRLKGRVKSGQNKTPGASDGYKPFAVATPAVPASGTSSPASAAQSPAISSAPAKVPSGGGTAAPAGGGSAASPPSVMVMPVALVQVQPASSPYVTAGMQDLTPIWSPDGMPVPATAPGRWGQLRAAGRP
jgi:hypothetical protein